MFDDDTEIINYGLYEKQTHFDRDEIFLFQDHLKEQFPYHQTFVRTLFEIYRHERFLFISTNQFGITVAYPLERFRGKDLKRLVKYVRTMDWVRTENIELTTTTYESSLYNVIEATFAAILINFDVTAPELKFFASCTLEQLEMVNNAMNIMSYPIGHYFVIFFSL